MSSNRNVIRTWLFASVAPVAVAAALLPAAALAQQASSDQLETVVVTAQKRTQNVQNVPIAITAITAATLQNKGVTDIHGLNQMVPNVSLDAGAPFSGDTSVLSASIRGIGQDDFAFNLDPGVGVYVDGVYLARTIGANVGLLDVARVEVLKGPQGTLFGRNTIGGAISIVTRTPGDHAMFEGQVTTGSFNRRDIAVTADVPLSDTVRTSFTFSSLQRDGYQKVIPYNMGTYAADQITQYNGGTWTAQNLGGQNVQTMRGKVLWLASDKFTVTATADWMHEDQSGMPNTVLQSFPNTPNAAGSIAGLYNACLAGAPIGVLCTSRRADGFPSSGGLPPLAGSNLMPITAAATQTGNIDTTYANGPNFAKVDNVGFGLTLEYQLNEDMTLKSITGYRHINWNIGTDQDGAANNGMWLDIMDKQEQSQESEELQLTGKAFGSRLHYVAGVFYFHESGFVHDWVPFDGGLLMVDGNNLMDTTSYAGYAHADYEVTDKLGITVGARYSYDHKRFMGEQIDQNGLSYKASGCYPPTASAALLGAPAFLTCQEVLGFPVAGQPFRYFPAGWNTQDFYNFSPTAGVQYHLTDDKMVYFSWSKGYKDGGWTTRLSQPISDARAAAFAPEKAETYEVGLKSEWLDHRLLANIAAFYTNYSNIQLNQQIGASPTIKNLGDAIIDGVEVESQAILGGGFTVHGSLGYINDYYTRTGPGVVNIANGLPPSVLPKTAKWKINLNPQYDMTLGNGGDLNFSLDYSHISSMYNDSENTALLKRPTSDLLDLSVQYTTPDGKYSIIAGGTNVTDARFITTGNANYAAGFVTGTYSPPAEWYVTLRAKY
ncbi:MAG: TonB-dependent receptor [Alphaproteobacteria bacterium]|nr:TonB-dependent receptor [Alphaproteobacteria bacterium]MDE2011527.1 TonB-dependent receptor [Alphaproteobacteria bacterium]MDE2073971.1 TonB-dependent receptor [Alphaproteobacteria bacterium]MDE2351241.1 TonB-dependent receptor [Alphaproteobacteria bacterium]